MGNERSYKFTWDWTPDEWAWSPDAGRWRPEYGPPSTCVAFEVTTSGLTPIEAYDYWRETVFYGFDADRNKSERAPDFSARASGLLAARAEFYTYQSDGISGRRTRKQARADGNDDVTLGSIFAGRRWHRDDRDSVVTSAVGNLFFYDAARPSRVEWEAHCGSHLTLRRADVVEALGQDVPPAGLVADALSRSSLSAQLGARMRLLSDSLSILTRFERSLLLDGTVELALAALQQAVCVTKGGNSGQRESLFAAARRLIDKNLEDPDLDAGRVALALGCSRATLYRAFSDHGLTIYGYIRELRLQRVRKLLGAAERVESIADLARASGFRDPSNFGRVFRQRFGQSPRDAAASMRRHARDRSESL